jgi:sortase A
VRALLRFIGAVLATSGILLVLDAGLTLAWQEPLSALLVQRQQAQLERELEHSTATVSREFGRRPSVPPDRQLIRRLARRERDRLKRGRAVGTVSLPTLDRRYTVVHDSDTATLRKGPAHFPKTPLPG